MMRMKLITLGRFTLLLGSWREHYVSIKVSCECSSTTATSALVDIKMSFPFCNDLSFDSFCYVLGFCFLLGFFAVVYVSTSFLQDWQHFSVFLWCYRFSIMTPLTL